MTTPALQACTREEFMRAFKLPKVDWHQAGNGESFKVAAANAFTGITAIYARTGNNHWLLFDSCLLKHAQIMGKIQIIINEERDESFA